MSKSLKQILYYFENVSVGDRVKRDNQLASGVGQFWKRMRKLVFYINKARRKKRVSGIAWRKCVRVYAFVCTRGDFNNCFYSYSTTYSNQRETWRDRNKKNYITGSNTIEKMCANEW